jgi:hypothetical protein
MAAKFGASLLEGRDVRTFDNGAVRVVETGAAAEAAAEHLAAERDTDVARWIDDQLAEGVRAKKFERLVVAWRALEMAGVCTD